MHVFASQAADPVIRMIASGIAQHSSPRHHPLPELVGKGGQRILGHTQRP